MNIKENKVTEPATLESIASSIERLDVNLRADFGTKIDASIRASEDSLTTNLVKKIGQSIMASEQRLTMKIEDSFDELARNTQNEFVQIGKRFGTLETKMDDGFARVDKKFVDVQSQLDHIYNNYPMRREHELLSGRVSKIERKLSTAHR